MKTVKQQKKKLKTYPTFQYNCWIFRVKIRRVKLKRSYLTKLACRSVVKITTQLIKVDRERTVSWTDGQHYLLFPDRAGVSRPSFRDNMGLNLKVENIHIIEYRLNPQIIQISGNCFGG